MGRFEHIVTRDNVIRMRNELFITFDFDFSDEPELPNGPEPEFPGIGFYILRDPFE